MKASITISFDTPDNTRYAAFRKMVDDFIRELEGKRLSDEDITIRIHPTGDKILLLEKEE